MGGITALRKIQFGRESTAGTPVAAATIWRGVGLLKDEREVVLANEQIGVATGTTRAYIPKLAATVELDPVECTFQQLPHLLEMGIKAATPVQDGAGSGYVRVYAIPTTAANTIKTYTVEMGDDQLVQETDYAFCTALSLSGAAGEAVMMSGTLRGRDVVDASFTGGLSAPALVPADTLVVGGCKLYIDAVSGTIGTTEKTSTLLSFELEIDTGLAPKYTNLGKDFDFAYFDRGSFKATCKFVYEHNATADSERDAFEAGTPRQFRLRFLGAALGTPATESTLSLNVDFAGVYTAFEASDADGNATVEAEVAIAYDATADLCLEFRVVNEDSVIPG